MVDRSELRSESLADSKKRATRSRSTNSRDLTLAGLVTLFSVIVGAAIVVIDLPVTVTLICAAGVVSLLAGVVARYLRRPSKVTKIGPAAYAQRLGGLIITLRQASSEVDGVLEELTAVAREREKSVEQLETHLTGLASREQELTYRIDALNKIQPAAAEYLVERVAAIEKRSARRDYFLFCLGVLVSTVVSILFFVLQGM